MKNITKADIAAMNELEIRKLLMEVKERIGEQTPQDTRMCREFVCEMKELFVDEGECPECGGETYCISKPSQVKCSSCGEEYENECGED